MNPCAGRIDPASFRVNVQGMPLAGRLWHAPQPRAVVLILHDSSQPATTMVSDWIPKGLCGR